MHISRAWRPPSGIRFSKNKLWCIWWNHKCGSGRVEPSSRTGRSVVWSPAPDVHMSKWPRARYWNSNCSRWLFNLCVFVCVNADLCCRALYKVHLPSLNWSWQLSFPAECYDQRHVGVDSHPKRFANSPKAFLIAGRWRTRRATISNTDSHIDSGDPNDSERVLSTPQRLKASKPHRSVRTEEASGMRGETSSRNSSEPGCLCSVCLDWDASQRSVRLSVFSGPHTGRSSPFTLPFCCEIPVNKDYKRNTWRCVGPCWQRDWAFRQNCWLLLWCEQSGPFFPPLKVVSVLHRIHAVNQITNQKIWSQVGFQHVPATQKAEGAGNHQHLILFYPRGRPAGTWCSGSFMVCLSLCTFSVNKRREKSSVKQQYGPRYAKHIVNSWTIWQKWKRTCC